MGVGNGFVICCQLFFLSFLIFLLLIFSSFAPHALKGQKLLAQGIALGYYGRNPVALFYSN